MTILEKIKQHKIAEVEQKKALYPIKLLEESVYFNGDCVSMKEYIKNPIYSGIIAEFKRKSPSKGFINKYASPEEITIGYMQAGASALSLLTDEHFFGAKKNDIITARKFNFCPILRKDFIIDEYQILEAKSLGADCILLIARILTQDQIINLSEEAKKLGLEVFLEIHSENELNISHFDNIDLIGINNRNLETFEVDIENSIKLAQKLPQSIVKIAESGLNSVKTINTLKSNGFDGFLIGEYFMKHSNPAQKCKELIIQLNNAG